MISVTDEMRLATYRAARQWAAEHGHRQPDDRMLDAAATALLAVVERNLRPAPGPDRCSACGRTARHLTPVTELVDGQPTVVARLGPSCYRDHLRAGAGRRQALPIGGDQ